MSGNKSSEQSQSQQTATQGLDPQIKGALLGNYANTQALAASTPTSYTGPLVAGFDPAQTQAQSGILALANSGLGNSELDQATATAGNVAGYTPSTVAAGQLSNTDLSPYLNPYTQAVTNTTMADLGRQNQIANEANDASATQQGAFGGDRSAVLDAQTNEGYARTAATTLAGLNQSNFTQAQTAAQSDIAARQAAATSNQSAGIAGAGLNLNAASSLAALSGQKLTQATQLQNLIAQVGAQRQAQAQAGLTANQQQFQTNFGNKVTMQQLISQALGLAGDPTLTQSQGTSSGSKTQFGFTLPSPAELAGG